MAHIHETTVTLRFFGDDLDPTEITAQLGRSPTIGAKKDGVWTTEGGTEKIARTGTWRLAAKDRRPGDLNGQVSELLATLNDDLSIWTDLTARFQADVFCGLWMEETNEAISLSVATMKELSARNLRVWLDVYDPTP